ncbi:MAG: hypothetical protein GF400_08440 [Candidatus Eisenbacteria bacterium]|nr:hypothetical protein [Candidatus Eisenbacteria bacterium]
MSKPDVSPEPTNEYGAPKSYAAHSLISSVASDPVTEPERSSLTLGRVEEVVELVVGEGDRAALTELG